MAGGDNGTMCFLPDFIRSAGMVRISFSQSTSLQIASLASPPRSSVKAINNKQYLAAHQ